MVLSLIAGFAVLTILVMGTTIGDISLGFVNGYVVEAAGVVVALTFVALSMMQRPQDGQTSYFQPVRVSGLKRRFRDGRIERIRFSFTNPAYQSAFERENQHLIGDGLVEIG